MVRSGGRRIALVTVVNGVLASTEDAEVVLPVVFLFFLSKMTVFT